jgi:VanZ family protein
MTRYSRFLPPILWLTVGIIYILAILPRADVPAMPGTDKVQHIAAFITLGVLSALALPRFSLLKIASWLALFGALIEFTQMIPVLHRDASMLDWLADLCAIAGGLLIVAPFRRNAENAR